MSSRLVTHRDYLKISAIGFIAASAFAMGGRGGDVDQRYPKETLIQHGGPISKINQQPEMHPGFDHLVACSCMAADEKFSVARFGVAADGVTLDTAAIQKAMDACAAAGGGRVLFPPGRYLSGTLRMRSGMDLHLAKDARLIGAKDLNAYAGFEATQGDPKPPQTRWARGLIVGENLTNIQFSGQGVIDGNQAFDPNGEEKMRGPHTILLAHCRNVTLRDLTLHGSANYAFLFYYSAAVCVEGATFEGGWDGVHFRGSPKVWNRGVRITNCKFFTGDDSIAGHYVEDIVIKDCVINTSCNGVRLIGPARRFTIENCEFYGPGRFPHRTQSRTNMLAGLILQPSSWGQTPGPLEDVRIGDITMRDVQSPFQISLRHGNTGRGLVVERLKATGVYLGAASVESWGEQPFRDVAVRNVEIEYTGGGKPSQAPVREPGKGVHRLPAWGFYTRNVDGLSLDDIRLRVREPDERPVLLMENVERLRMRKVMHPPPPPGVEPFDLQNVKQVSE